MSILDLVIHTIIAMITKEMTLITSSLYIYIYIKDNFNLWYPFYDDNFSHQVKTLNHFLFL